MTIYHIAMDHAARYPGGNGRGVLANVLCGAEDVPLYRLYNSDEPSYHILEFAELIKEDFPYICEDCKNTPEFGLWLLNQTDL